MKAVSARITAVLSASVLGVSLFTASGANASAGASAAPQDPNTKTTEQIAYDCDHPVLATGTQPYLQPDCKVVRVYEEKKYAEPPKIIGEPLKNCSDVSGAQGYSKSHTIGKSFSWGMSPGLGMGLLISANLGWETSESETVEYSSTVYMPAMGIGWLTYKAPMKQARYDIQATYRVDFQPSVTRTVTGGVVSTADSENLQSGWIAKSRAMTENEINQNCPQNGSGTEPNPGTGSTYGPDYRFWAASQGRWLNSYSNFCLSNEGSGSKQRACAYPISMNQRFKTSPTSGGYFSLKNTGTGKCLTGTAGSTEGSQVSEATCVSGNFGQNWEVTPIRLKLPPYTETQPGYYFANRANGLCLALHSDELLRDLGRVAFQSCGSLPRTPLEAAKYDQWAVTDKSGYMNRVSGLCLDLGETYEGGGFLVQRKCSASSGQTWKAVAASNGYFTIRNKNGRCLTVPWNDGVAPGENTQLLQWGCATDRDHDNQMWEIDQTAVAGVHTFSSKWTGLCLSPHKNDLTKNGGRVTFRKCT